MSHYYDNHMVIIYGKVILLVFIVI